MGDLLSVEGLNVAYGTATVVRDVSFSVAEGEIVGIVGESGAGKSTVLHAVAGLLPSSAHVGGSILFNVSAANPAEDSRADVAAKTTDGLPQNLDLVHADEEQMHAVRGSQISTIFQNPASTFDPAMRVGAQIAELVRLKRGMGRTEAKREALQLLERMRFGEPDSIYRAYPFELSGGMQQRAAIAMAMAFRPKLLLADEPTSALDATTQAAILHELVDLNCAEDTALLIVTHNIALAAHLCRRIMVMEGGRIVETGPACEVIGRPRSACAKKLVASIPQLAR